MKKLIATIALLLASCASLVTAAAGGLGGGVAAAFEAPAYIVALTAAGASFGTDLYLKKEEAEVEADELRDALTSGGGLSLGIFGFLSKILDFAIGAGIVIIIILVISRGPRKAFGKVVRLFTGNTPPKKWVTENWERLNKHDELLENFKKLLEDKNEISKN